MPIRQIQFNPSVLIFQPDDWDDELDSEWEANKLAAVTKKLQESEKKRVAEEEERKKAEGAADEEEDDEMPVKDEL